MAICRLQGFEEKQEGIYYEYDSGISPLGEGAMGRVYKGYRVEENTGSGIPVAIKELYTGLPDMVIERARRGASVRIDNPFLLKMYGFIEAPGSSATYGQTNGITKYYVVMELVTGVTLHDLIKGLKYDMDGQVSKEVKRIHDEYVAHKYATIQYLMSKILCGVHALHAANIILCNFDPDSIMITDDGGIKIVDFGVCKPIKSSDIVNFNMSFSFNRLQTNYAAPELLLGDESCLAPSTDIYALGVLIFQMCTGKLPFNGPEYDVTINSLNKPLPLHEIEHRSWRRIINRATQKIQSKRYSSVEEMLQDFEKVDISDNATILYNYMLYILVLLGVVLCATYLIHTS